MRCSTCGEHLQPGSVACPTCGAPTQRAITRPAMVRRCPRCGYWGQGVNYFSRPAHLGVLAGLSLFTYGIGGLTYWMVCRKRRVCPSCGYGWENATRLIEAPRPGEAATPLAGPTSHPTQATEPAEALPGNGIGRRVIGAGVVLLASLMILVGIVEFEAAAIAVGGVLGAGGSLTFLWGWQALQSRRKAIMKGMERKVLLLAQQRGGTLTVTEVAAELDLTLPAAEKILIGMDDGFRVRSEITEDGILLYDFPEVRHRVSGGEGLRRRIPAAGGLEAAEGRAANGDSAEAVTPDPVEPESTQTS